MNFQSLKGYKNYLLFPQKPLLSLGILSFTIVGGAFITLQTSQAIKNNHTPQIMSRLTTLQSQLTTLQQAVNKPLPEINVDAITQQIALLSDHLNQLHTINPEEFNQTLNHTEANLRSQLNAIQTVVNHLDAKTNPIKYVNHKHLPFKVVSLDSIQQIPVASLAYDFKVVPLEKNDALAGWTLIHLDYGKQRIEFENARKERVLITNKHIG